MDEKAVASYQNASYITVIIQLPHVAGSLSAADKQQLWQIYEQILGKSLLLSQIASHNTELQSILSSIHLWLHPQCENLLMMVLALY